MRALLRFLSYLSLAVGLAPAASAQTVREVAPGVTAFTPPGGTGTGAFGRALALDGSLAAIGASRENVSGTVQGAVYLFRHDGARWHYEARLTRPDSVGDNEFGTSVDVSTAGGVDRVLVGQYNANPQPPGRAHVYRRDEAGTWRLEASFREGRTFRDGFGNSVALEDTIAVVGAHLDGSGGSVFVYEARGGAWPLVQRIVAPPPTTIEHFGYQVGLSGKRLLVFTRNPEHYLGEPVYAFERRSGRWEPDGRLDTLQGNGSGYGWRYSTHPQVLPSGDRAVLVAYDPAPIPYRTSFLRRGTTGWVLESDLDLRAAGFEPQQLPVVAFDRDLAVVALRRDPLRQRPPTQRYTTRVLYRRVEDQWQIAASLPLPDSVAGALPYSLALRSNLALYYEEGSTSGDVRHPVYAFDFTRVVSVAEEEAAETAGAYVFPNPARDRATLRYHAPGAGPARVTVYDVTGRAVLTASAVSLGASLGTVTLDTSALPSGLYLVRVVSEGEPAQAKLVVTR